jgi:hypothetical protein
MTRRSVICDALAANRILRFFRTSLLSRDGNGADIGPIFPTFAQRSNCSLLPIRDKVK